jgi:small subunit ribosomal protein S1
MQGLRPVNTPAAAGAASASSAKADLSSLGAMLQSKWKSGAAQSSKPEEIQSGQIRSFKITKLDADGKKIPYSHSIVPGGLLVMS